MCVCVRFTINQTFVVSVIKKKEASNALKQKQYFDPEDEPFVMDSIQIDWFIQLSGICIVVYWRGR
jgi:hypothetical protein